MTKDKVLKPPEKKIKAPVKRAPHTPTKPEVPAPQKTPNRLPARSAQVSGKDG